MRVGLVKGAGLVLVENDILHLATEQQQSKLPLNVPQSSPVQSTSGLKGSVSVDLSVASISARTADRGTGWHE